MAAPSVTYTFSSSTTADASQVNQNFTDLINGVSDGTKDLSINALTCAGTATLNGNVTLGNASSDDVTITGSLASTINIKTTNSYNIGSATLGLASIYFGANSQTVRVLGSSSMSATWTLTLPVSAGTVGQFLVTNGSGVSSWRYQEKTTAKTTTYTGTGDETVVLVSASGGAWTFTLPAAADYSGKHYYIKKTDSSANAVTIDGNASETIDGDTTKKLTTQFESFKLVSDGSNWHVVNHFASTDWESFTPTGSWSANCSYSGRWRRVGTNIEVDVRIALTGAPTSAQLTINWLPNSWTVDTSKITVASNERIMGTGLIFDTSATRTYPCWARYSSTTAVDIRGVGADESYGYSSGVTHAAPVTFANGDGVQLVITAPITDWEP